MAVENMIYTMKGVKLMNNNEIQKLSELIKSPIKDINYNESTGFTEIIFENNQVIPLYGKHIELDYKINSCSFCGASSIDKILFTDVNEHAYICKECATMAIQTFLKNGVEINLDIGEFFPELAEKLNENINPQERPK